MKAKRNLLALVVCSLTLLIIYRYPAQAGQMRYSMELGLRVCVSLIMVGVLWKINRPIGAFLGLALISQFYPIFCSESARAFYNVFAGLVLYAVIVKYGNDDWTVQLMNMMCIIAILNVIPTFWQSQGYHLFWKGGTQTTGWMENSNSLSALLALCFPAFLRDRWKWFIPLVLYGLHASGSSGGVVAIAAGVGFYLMVAHRGQNYLRDALMIGAVAVGLIVFVFFVDINKSYEVRFEAWVAALNIFKDHWVSGCGLGRWKTEFVALALAGQFPEGFIRLHSTTLQSMMEMGIGFIIILCWYIFDIVKRSWAKWEVLAIPLSAIIIIMVNGSVNFLIRIGPNAALVIVWLAIMEISLRRLKDGTRRSTK